MSVPTPTTTVAAPPATQVTDQLPDQDRSSEVSRLMRVNRWLALVLVGLVVAIAAAVLLVDGPASTTTRAGDASAARWNAAAVQDEAIRTARANAAWTARLDAAAAQHQAIRRAAALDTDAARLTRQADVRAGR